MKATVTNPAKGSTAAKKKMAKVRAARKTSKKKTRINPVLNYKRPSEMKKAHKNISDIMNELNHKSSARVTFVKTDGSWLNYILSKI